MLQPFGWWTKVYVWKRSGPSNVILHRFCLTKGSTLISQSHYSNPWFMYQNRLGPSGGIYHPNFVPCFVYHQLNFIKKSSLANKWMSFSYSNSALAFRNQSSFLLHTIFINRKYLNNEGLMILLIFLKVLSLWIVF